MADEARVRLVRPADRTAGHPTPGMHREQATSTERTWAGHVTTEPGMVSGWHHHGDHESHIYVVSGAMRMESGPGGRDVVDAGPGDFIFVPPHTVHREGNPATEDATVVVVRAGTGEVVINVDGPEAADD
ncbi:cupin domain-containing protein [Angustibacter sp. Root456]|uniref:cupin domain-containing protein n=1 Tax=Angustibacter sp. Root456 TaxID=1736539 RepID=UPI0006FD8ECD|nr:cupin domain-containing protein [Angustibacter sp. Root456]KQX69798.1 cupin [Angustibacter sp. Root456]